MQLTFEVLPEEDIKTLEKERGYLVVKSNEFIQNSRFQLTLLEQKIILFLISKIKPEDIYLKSYDFEIAEFCKICGVDAGNGANYRYIRQTLKNLRDKSIWVSTEDGGETTFAWIDEVTLFRNSGKAIIRLNEKMKPFLIGLHEKFTQFELCYTLAMKSQYSPRFYELMKSHLIEKKKTYLLEELQTMLLIESQKNYSYFKRKILDVAMKEINELTDITVAYQANKKGKSVVSLTFFLGYKENPLKRLQVKGKIDSQLSNKKSESR